MTDRSKLIGLSIAFALSGTVGCILPLDRGGVERDPDAPVATEIAAPTASAARSTTAIQPDPENPRYWQYEGRAVLLIGGSIEDNLFQIDSLERHLDVLSSVGGNYVRNTMSSRDEGDVWPFERLPSGLYDLEELNDRYFERFKQLLELAEERAIIVQIELWDRFDFAREPWLSNPYRPANNVNYTVDESGLEDAYPRHPGQNDNPFFRSIPDHDANHTVLRYQRRQVDRLLEISLRHPNVLYVMDNETNATPEWAAFWARYVRQKANNQGRTVHVTEMWDAWDLKDEQHRRTLDYPELYSFADIAQNNHNTGDKHWANLQWARAYVGDRPRPLNNVKIYGADTGRYGTKQDAVERFWRNILGGAASVRFHRPATGIGLSPTAQAHIKSARLLQTMFDVFEAQPDTGHALLLDRSPNEAFVTRTETVGYAVYFPRGGEVGLDLQLDAGGFTTRWIDAERSTIHAAGDTDGSRVVRLVAPGEGHWIAVLTRRD